MAAKEFKDYSINDIPALILDNVDSVIIVDSNTDSYRALKRAGIFENYIEETGTYHDLIVKLPSLFTFDNEFCFSPVTHICDFITNLRKEINSPEFHTFHERNMIKGELSITLCDFMRICYK